MLNLTSYDSVTYCNNYLSKAAKAQIYQKRHILRMKSLTRKDCTVAMGAWQID